MRQGVWYSIIVDKRASLLIACASFLLKARMVKAAQLIVKFMHYRNQRLKPTLFLLETT